MPFWGLFHFFAQFSLFLTHTPLRDLSKSLLIFQKWLGKCGSILWQLFLAGSFSVLGRKEVFLTNGTNMCDAAGRNGSVLRMKGRGLFTSPVQLPAADPAVRVKRGRKSMKKVLFLQNYCKIPLIGFLESTKRSKMGQTCGWSIFLNFYSLSEKRIVPDAARRDLSKNIKITSKKWGKRS